MRFTKVRDVKTPSYGTDGSAGLDFYIPNEFPRTYLKPGESVNIPSGIKMIINSGYCGLFLNKSGIGIQGVTVGAQVVDSDYRGEVHLNVHNISRSKTMTLEPGQKLVQMLIMPVLKSELEEISPYDYKYFYENTKRGTGGFGSTGKF